MLSNTLEFRDDAGNEIAFFEKKKKRKCGQSVAMVSAWQFSRQQTWLNQRWYLLLQGDATWGPRRSCCYTSASLSGQEKLRQHFSTCRWSLHCIGGNPSLNISQPSLLSDFFISPNFFLSNSFNFMNLSQHSNSSCLCLWLFSPSYSQLMRNKC